MPRALSGSLKLLKLQKHGFCLVLSQRGKLVPYKLCLMTCTELAGRSCSHPACHIFASRTDKENHSHTRPGLGQQCSRARPLPSFSEPPEMGAGLRGGGWMRVATRRPWFWPILRPTGCLPDPAIPLCVGLTQRVCPLKLPLVCDLCPSFPDNSVRKESACSAGDPVRFLGREDPLEKG